MERRAAQLVAHSGRRAAAGYLREVESVWVRERALTERTDLSAAVATSLHRLTAYKDEYEVARMLTDKAFVASVAAEVPGASDLTYQLHPPVLRALGREKKIGFGPRSHVALRVLAKGRFLRGTKLDPFGRAEVRKVERRLLDHYRGLVDALLADLTDDSYAAAVEVARAPELVVGYEDVKLRNVDRYRARLGELGIDTSPIR